MLNDYLVGWIVYARDTENIRQANRRDQFATARAARRQDPVESTVRWSAVLPLASAGLFCLGAYTGFLG